MPPPLPTTVFDKPPESQNWKKKKKAGKIEEEKYRFCFLSKCYTFLELGSRPDFWITPGPKSRKLKFYANIVDFSMFFFAPMRRYIYITFNRFLKVTLSARKICPQPESINLMQMLLQFNL